MSDSDLEEGWRELKDGHAAVALKHAEAALAAEESADALTLLGAAYSQLGKLEDAERAFERACKLDRDDYWPAMLLAELRAGTGELEPALESATRAIDLAEEEEEFISALLLKAELELALEDDEAAVETLAELPPPEVPLPTVDLELRAAAQLMEIGELDDAEKRLEAANERAPDDADVVHLLGLCAEANGDEKRQLKYFLRTRELDLRGPKATFTDDQVEQACERALGELPEKARTLLKNVPILIEDYPSEELVKDGLDPRLLGVFDGVPFPEQPNEGGAPHLEHIALFKRNLERDAEGDPELIEDEIRTTLLHETAHFFGLDEEDLEALGLD